MGEKFGEGSELEWLREGKNSLSQVKCENQPLKKQADIEYREQIG
jgi:hypothetical protein